MNKKVCIKCGLEKELAEFHKKSSAKDGHRSDCKECCSIYSKEYRTINHEKIKKLKCDYYTCNREKIITKSKDYRNKNYYLVKEKDRVRSKLSYENRKDYMKTYNKENADKVRENKRRYEHKNKELLREKRKEVITYRMKIDPVFYLKKIMRKRLYDFLKTNNIPKNKKTFDVIGCSPKFLKEYIEKQFKDGMIWENKGKWHVDHIIPLSSANTEEELYNLCHYSNLQPLWAEENIKKGNKIL